MIWWRIKMQGLDIELHNGSMAMQMVQINNLMRDFKTEAQRRRRCIKGRF